MTEIRGNVLGGGKKQMNRAENGSVKRKFDGYRDFDGAQWGRGTQCMSSSLCRYQQRGEDSEAIIAVARWKLSLGETNASFARTCTARTQFV